MIMTWFWSTDLACEKGKGVQTWFWNSTRVYTHDSGEPLLEGVFMYRYRSDELLYVFTHGSRWLLVYRCCS